MSRNGVQCCTYDTNLNAPDSFRGRFLLDTLIDTGVRHYQPTVGEHQPLARDFLLILKVPGYKESRKDFYRSFRWYWFWVYICHKFSD